MKITLKFRKMKIVPVYDHIDIRQVSDLQADPLRTSPLLSSGTMLKALRLIM